VSGLTKADTGRWSRKTKIMAMASKRTRQRRPSGALESRIQIRWE
jgi:hypothetical protein